MNIYKEHLFDIYPQKKAFQFRQVLYEHQLLPQLCLGDVIWKMRYVGDA